MSSASLHAPYTVLIQGNRLTVTKTVAGVRRVFCSLHIDEQASFCLRDGKVVYLTRFGQDHTFDTSSSEEAHELLNQLTDAQGQSFRDEVLATESQHAEALEDALEDLKSRHVYELATEKSRHAGELAAAKSRQATQRCISPTPLFVLAVAASLFGFGAGFWFGSEKQSAVSASVGQPGPYSALIEPKPLIANITPGPVLSATNAAVRSVDPVPSPTTATELPSDGWALPQEIRSTLPDKLYNAAQRKLFTVDYSSGHARTLYVFSDPSCPNCKHLEPALNALSDAFNVVVFPVPVIGKEKSIAAITPVLCLPPEQRKAAWDALFDPAPDGLNLGKQPEEQVSEVADSKAAQPGECDVAEKALGINQVAYQAYRIPGTPWAISDDGRYVSQALLRDPLKLQVFLDEQPAHQGQEVSHASQ